MMGYAYYEYLSFENNLLFTMIALPNKDGNFPTVICRSPYVGNTANQAETDLTEEFLRCYSSYLERGYAVVFQHCRGCGKSTGEFIPYIHEREDGINLQNWIRTRPFYNGELFLSGGSYTASLHYTTAPFEKDIRGAIFEVQDTERYRLWYRNGQMRKGHANWHFCLYKNKTLLKKNFSMRSFAQLPLKGLSEKALGERADDFENMLYAREPSHKFWNTRYGGQDARDAVTNANIPILLTTGYNDFYLGGMFKMWNKMDEQTKSKCAFLVSPYDHGDGYDANCGISFPKGRRAEQFNSQYGLDWLDHIRKGTPIPYEKGTITYYRAFENRWDTDFYKTPTEFINLRLGEKAVSFDYDPYTPTAFSCEGSKATNTGSQNEFVSLCTPPFDRDLFIKGQMKAVLTVSSNCADTSFFVRISIKKPEYTYVLRHDITSLCYQLGTYKANEVVKLDFCFDEYAFLLKQGECLQIDVASTDDNGYVSHTNNSGEYHLQTDAKKAVNTVYLDKSYLSLPVEI